MKILVFVPENTLPYRCGERFMICEYDMEIRKIERCEEFFKDEKEAKRYAKENGIPDYTGTVKVRAV